MFVVASLLLALPHDSPAQVDEIAPLDGGPGHAGVTWRVQNFGVDMANCGTATQPCRSITQAINKAEAGDTVLVGPGRYGDINGDGDFSDSGDEQGDSSVITLARSGIRIISQEGAAVTLIDATGSSFNTAVMIVARGSQFGAAGHGFRVLAVGRLLGIDVQDVSSHIRVAGNVVMGGAEASYRFPTRGRASVIADNIAIDTNGPGFIGQDNVLDPGADGPTRVVRNIAIRNRVGFIVGGPDLVFVDNVADDNVQGAFLGGDNVVVRRNFVGASGREGMLISGTLKAFTDNSVIGSRGPGITLFNGTSAAQFSRNNIFGNGASETIFAGEPQPNCGLYNASRMNLAAPNNFWGAPNGPGPDPADAVCNFPGSSTVVDPVAVRPFRTPRNLPR
jgi:hypothetical protein